MKQEHDLVIALGIIVWLIYIENLLIDSFVFFKGGNQRTKISIYLCSYRYTIA